MVQHVYTFRHAVKIHGGPDTKYLEGLFSHVTSWNSNNTLTNVSLPFLQMRTLRLRDTKLLAQGHTISKWQSQNLSSDATASLPIAKSQGIP